MCGCHSKTHVVASFIVPHKSLAAQILSDKVIITTICYYLYGAVCASLYCFFICLFSFFTVLLTKPQISNCSSKPLQRAFRMRPEMHVMQLQNNTAFSDQPLSAPAIYEMLRVLPNQFKLMLE